MADVLAPAMRVAATDADDDALDAPNARIHFLRRECRRHSATRHQAPNLDGVVGGRANLSAMHTARVSQRRARTLPSLPLWNAWLPTECGIRPALSSTNYYNNCYIKHLRLLPQAACAALRTRSIRRSASSSVAKLQANDSRM